MTDASHASSSPAPSSLATSSLGTSSLATSTLATSSAASPFPVAYLDDIYTEAPTSDNTVDHLGPLRALAGTWEGAKGFDVHPQVDGPEREPYVERWTFDVMDAQANGPQVYYGLRYHQHITKPSEAETFHDQVGYLLWEPATCTLIMTLAIPRAQIAMASGTCDPGAHDFELSASAEDAHFTISSAPFLDAAFRTSSWRIEFRVRGDQLTYSQTTVLHPYGSAEPFAHTDANVLTRVAEAAPNPRAGGPLLR